MSTFLSCPFQPCSFSITNSRTAPKAMRNHWQTKHPDSTLKLIDPSALTSQFHLHTCPHCLSPKHTYLTAHHLTNHISTTHPTTTMEPNPSLLGLITATYHQAPISDWDTALRFLHTLPYHPAPFRSNLWKKLSQHTKKEYFAAYHNLQQWIIDSQPHLPDPDSPPPASQ